MAEQDLVGHGVRLYANQTGTYRFRYGLGVVGPDEEPEADRRIDLDPLVVWVDGDSLEHLEGATLRFDSDIPGGLLFDNPRSKRHFDDPIAERVHELIERRVNPSIAAHGGYMDLVRVEGTTAYVEMGGGCRGCGMARETLREVAEGQILAEITELERVVDTTDHSGGENPYFKTD